MFQMSALMLLNLLVAWPYLARSYSSHSGGNDSAYIAIARLFREQPWTWNSFQYCGTPFRFLYPPIFHVIVASIPLEVSVSFHFVSWMAYALVAVAVYYLTLQLWQSCPLALFAGLLYSVSSPVYLLLPAWRAMGSGQLFAPFTLVALTRYDESPHILALSLGLFSIAYACQQRWRLSCCFGAAVLLTSLTGAVGFFFILLAFGLARIRETRFVQGALSTFTLGGTAFGMSAFWLTPGFVLANALSNPVTIAPEGAVTHWTPVTFAIVLLGLSIVVLAYSARLSSGLTMIITWIAISGTVVSTFATSGVSLVPLANRYGLELNVSLLLGIVSVVSYVPTRYLGFTVIPLLCVGAWTVREFVTHPWDSQMNKQASDDSLSLEIADWLQRNSKGARIFAAGEIEGALNSWSTVRQTGGSFAGMSNLTVIAAAKQIRGSCEALAQEKEVTALWLRALNVGYVVVNDASSAEYYHLLAHPVVFATYKSVWSDQTGNSIVSVPSNGGEAVVVDLRALARLPKMHSLADLVFLRAYTTWALGKRPARFYWNSNDHGTLNVGLGPQEGILIKTSYDPGWRSSAGDVQSDPIGFILIRGTRHQGSQHLYFTANWDVLLSVVITFVTMLCLVFWMPALPYTAAIAVLIWAGSFFALQHKSAPNSSVTPKSLHSNQLPLISAGGIIDVSAKLSSKSVRVVSIYGLNFERLAVDTRRVLFDGKEGKIIFHSPSQLNVELPPGSRQKAVVSVEVNDCLGNSFLLHNPSQR